MKHFPIFLAVEGRRIVVSGGGEAALAKLRLLMKTEGRITVLAASPAPEIVDWAAADRLTLIARAMEPGDTLCAALFYAANENDAEDARVARLAHADGTLVNIVDNLADSAFITPAIVDRDPVTVAIGTEGTAPVLARAIKKDIEDRLPATLGLLARIGKAFRPMAGCLPTGRVRRAFWAEYYFDKGPRAAVTGGESGIGAALNSLLNRYLTQEGHAGYVDFVGAGPGNPALLTLEARNALDKADVVIYDRLIAPEILDLARREAVMIEAGKTGSDPSTPQSTINGPIVHHAANGAYVVRLKSGDLTVFGRLDEEIDAVAAAGIAWHIVPGIAAASAAVASIGQSLTRRGRNGTVQYLTDHDIDELADHNWRALAQQHAVAAICMGKRSARYTQGRPTMHDTASLTGPELTVIGPAPRAALAAADLPTPEKIAL